MSQHLLLVDDSEAVLAYEKAALAGLYTLSTATTGAEALRKVRELAPDAVLLDLSMPGMDGDEVLARMQEEPELARIPVIVVSSEKERAAACLQAGAVAFLPKPVKAEDLRVIVARTLEARRLTDRAGTFAVLPVGVGAVEVGIPLDCVRSVVLHPATRPFSSGISYLDRFIDFHGRPIGVLDLARPLRAVHEQHLTERKLVVVENEGVMIALSVDRVRDPEEVAPSQIAWRSSLAGNDARLLSRALSAVARTARGTLPIITPGALFSRAVLRALPQVVARAADLGAEQT